MAISMMGAPPSTRGRSNACPIDSIMVVKWVGVVKDEGGVWPFNKTSEACLAKTFLASIGNTKKILVSFIF